MRNAHAQFTENLRRARELGGLAIAVENMTTTAIDVSDLLRSQIVLSVSALDHLVHELVRLGMIEISQGARAKTDGYLRYQMPVTAIESALSGIPHAIWVGETVREKHAWQSFQDPDKIADAIRLISSIKLWEEVGLQLHMTAQDIKTRLKLVVDRRNKIAHEADIDPANPGFRWAINSTLVNDTVYFIEKVGDAIYKATI